MTTKRYVVAALLLVTAALAILACRNQSRDQTTSADNSTTQQPEAHAGAEQPVHPTGKFDYYVLVLSWAPEFCATHADNRSSTECDPDRHLGWVVHGMWPQNGDGSYPLNCGAGAPVSQATVRRLLNVMPSRGLIQHEWRAHGTCTGLPADDYFTDIEQAYEKLQIPGDFRTLSHAESLSPAKIASEFAQANNAPLSAVRVSCSGGELVGVELCLSKDLRYRTCGSGVRDCRAAQVMVRPTL